MGVGMQPRDKDLKTASKPTKEKEFVFAKCMPVFYFYSFSLFLTSIPIPQILIAPVWARAMFQILRQSRQSRIT